MKTLHIIILLATSLFSQAQSNNFFYWEEGELEFTLEDLTTEVHDNDVNIFADDVDITIGLLDQEFENSDFEQNTFDAVYNEVTTEFGPIEAHVMESISNEHIHISFAIVDNECYAVIYNKLRGSYTALFAKGEDDLTDEYFYHFLQQIEVPLG